jgi:hypothetical protein
MQPKSLSHTMKRINDKAENCEIIRHESSTGWRYQFKTGSLLHEMDADTLVTKSGLKLENPYYDKDEIVKMSKHIILCKHYALIINLLQSRQNQI